MSLWLLSFIGLAYLYRGRRLFDLMISGLAAGLSWLTKSPAFILVPVVGLLSLVEFGREVLKARRLNWRDFWPVIRPLLIWGGIGVLIFILLWPAMWVNPVSVLQHIFAEAEIYATEGHSTDIFFAGKVIAGDPGWRFYPVTYLWRSTPIVLLGLVLWLIGSLFHYQSPHIKQATWPAIALVLFSLLFTIFMTVGSKKFDRYLLPIYAPLDLVAGLGWVMAASWLGERIYLRKPSLITLILLAIVVIGQAEGALRTYPYYLSYYNPLLGGSLRAPQVMMIGWGEGIDQAARYLNEKPDVEHLRVMSWYPDGSFSYLFKGETLGAAPEWEQTEPIVFNSDYVVTYIHQWQRGLPFPEMLAYFAEQTPEKVISLNGLEYAQIYNIHTLPGIEDK
jgi:4-amino-4-deoxy-L-arabinose transferase-like glycosyltransferase